VKSVSNSAEIKERQRLDYANELNIQIMEKKEKK
jgi:hypothetical protein